MDLVCTSLQRLVEVIPAGLCFCRIRPYFFRNPSMHSSCKCGKKALGLENILIASWRLFSMNAGRRDAMKSALIFIFALLSASAADAAGRFVTYQVDGAPYEGYYAPSKAGAPMVLLIHDWDGLTDYEVQRSEMLSKMGYAVFAADLFGAGVRPTRKADKRQHTGELYKDRAKMRALISGALKKAKSLGADTGRAVVAGYCFGGAAVLEYARSGVDMKGFVTFHGGLSTPEGQDYKRTRGRLLILHGAADTAISMDDFIGLAKELEQSGVAHEMVLYGGAPHAFTVFGGNRYRKDADRKSWRRFTEFLADTLNAN
jgi:dienelactone hydrolase